jgi:hypothetical protein
MAIAEFMNYYPGYTLDKVLSMYAVSFYALLSSMYRLKGAEKLDSAVRTALATNGGEQLTDYIENARKQSDGSKALLRQAKVMKQIKESKK